MHSLIRAKGTTTLEAKWEIVVHIAQLEETGILVSCRSPWNMPLLHIKKPETSDFHESDSSRETRVQCFRPKGFSLLLTEVNQPIFAFTTGHVHNMT